MGEVIRKNASAGDIFADVRAALANARAKGAPFVAAAEEKLGPVVALIDAVEARERAALEAFVPLRAGLVASDEAADRLLGRVSDEVWNDVGRPASDPALSILFPGGIAHYADGEVEGQPMRMEVLAELLEAGIHPKLPAEKAAEYARRVREGASALKSATDAAETPKARVEVLARVKTSVARSAQVELAALKRRYRSDGLGEAEIHSVIPDRPATKAKKPEPVTT